MGHVLMLVCPDDGDMFAEPASGPAAAPAHQGVLRQGDRQLQLHHPRPPGPGPAARGEERQEGRPHQEAGRGHPPQPRPQRAPGGPDTLLRHRSIGSTTGCTITEKAPTMAFSWLKAPTSAFTFKTLLRHYAKRALTPRSLNVKLGPRQNYHKGRAAIRHYANQTARPL